MNDTNKHKFISIRDAVKITGIEAQTLRKMADAQKIKCYRTLSKQRKFDRESLEQFCCNLHDDKIIEQVPRKNFLYARVSSRKQMDDLSRQIEFIRNSKPQYSSFQLITDVASGINFKRKGLQTILDSCLSGTIGEIIVAHKDRLCRFGFDLVKLIVTKSGGIIMKYFFENKIKETDYECNFYSEILYTCNEVLIAVSKNYRNRNILLETQIISKKKIIKLNEELEHIPEKQKEMVNVDIEGWKSLTDDLDNTTQQVKKIYEYKIEAYENPNKIIFYDYNIPLDFVFDNLRISSSKSKKYYEHLNNLISKYSRSVKNKYYFSYDSVNKFINELHIEKNEKLKIHFMNILLCTQEIYENYINIIQKYNQSIISKLRKDNKVVKNIITEKIEKKFNTIIKNYEIENNIKDCQIKNLLSILEKKNIKNNKNSKKLELSFNDETEFVKDINLQIYFSKNIEKYICSQEALAIMINNGLKKKESENLLNKFYKSFTDCRKLEFIENETIPHLYYKD
jgi:predicted site-specific integrase-resolvase